MSQSTLFIKRIGLTGIAQTISGLKGIITLPILTKVLGPSDYGIWVQILVTISLLQPFIRLGLPFAMVRFLPSKEKREIGQGVITYLTVILLTSTIAALIVFSLSDSIAINLFKTESAVGVIRIASLLVIFEAMSGTVLGSFRIFGQIKRYALILILESILEVGLISFFVLNGYNLIGAVISLLTTKAIMLLIMLYLVVSHAGFSFPDFSILRPHLIYGIPLVPTAIFQFIISLSDRYVIGLFRGVSSVGIYAAAYNIAHFILMFHEFTFYVLLPNIYSSFDKQQINETKKYLSYSWQYVLMLLIPSAFGLSVLAEPLLGILTSVEFVQEGIIIIPIVAFSMIIYSISAIFGFVVRFSKHTGIVATAFGAAAVLNLGLNFFLIPLWGTVAAAVSTLCAYSLVAFIMYYKAGKNVKFDLKFGFIIKSILSSTIMAAIIWVIHPVNILMVMISILVGAIVYFIILIIIFRGFSQDEIKAHFRTIKENLSLFRRG